MIVYKNEHKCLFFLFVYKNEHKHLVHHTTVGDAAFDPSSSIMKKQC